MTSALHKTFVLRDKGCAQVLWAFLRANWQAMAAAGKPLAVTVSEYKTRRSIEQNKRYWDLLGEIATGAWLDGRQFGREAWHDYFKGLFIGFEDVPGGRQVAMSTTRLSVSEFADYMTRVEAFAAQELGVTYDIK